jgi:hypothetical protein
VISAVLGMAVMANAMNARPATIIRIANLLMVAPRPS